MRVRAAILVVVLGAAVAGCGGGGGDEKPSANSTRLGTPSGKVTEVSLDCAKYADTAQKIVQAQQELYAGSGGSTEALDTLKSEMDALKDGAPDDVKNAIDELDDAFAKVQEIITSNSATAQQQLASMGQKLSTDGQTITAYIVSRCKK